MTHAHEAESMHIKAIVRTRKLSFVTLTRIKPDENC